MDYGLLRDELDHFREWGMEAVYGPLRVADRTELDRCFDELARQLADVPLGFTHRDYQSRNLMWAPRGQQPSLVIIDFQDALMAPEPYDLVALLCDSYVALSAELQDSMIQRYLQFRKVETADFARAFWQVALQRKLKDAGRFVYIDRVRGNPDFLQWYAPSFVYMDRALTHLPEFASIQEILHRTIPGFPHDVKEVSSVCPAAERPAI